MTEFYIVKASLSVRDMPLNMSMSAEEALDLAIRKWETIVGYYEEGGKDMIFNGGWLTCALCHVHAAHGCATCPVRKASGRTSCEGTPYDDYIRAWTPEESHEYARAELEFLKSLLP